jgi:hypothetical protein
LNPATLVFFDETWTKTNMTRVRGRAPSGQQLVAAVPHGRWKTSTFIVALRLDGLTAPAVFDGAINGASILFLPAYSPDFNPIEQVFAKLKALSVGGADRGRDHGT